MDYYYSKYELLQAINDKLDNIQVLMVLGLLINIGFNIKFMMDQKY